MPKYVGYELADGSWSSDYKSGDKFVVSSDECNDCFYVGEVLSLHWDDGTQCPKFINDAGHADYEDWYCVKAYNTQKVPDFIERDTIVNLEVTGEELALINALVRNATLVSTGVTSLVGKLDKIKQSRDNFIVLDTIYLSKGHAYNNYLKKFFTKPEPQNVRLAKEKVEQAKKALEDAERESANLVG